MNTAFPNARLLAGVLIMSMATLAACQSPPPKETAKVAKAAEAATPATATPAPQAPFDTTSITPVESAGAAAE